MAPAGRPWSVWFFRDGQYVNLELPHERPLDGSLRTLSRDLTLDLWLEAGETWLKDADELEAGTAAGYYTPAEAETIRAIADQARRELVDPWAWPLDEGWERWEPPAAWDEPLTFEGR